MDDKNTELAELPMVDLSKTASNIPYVVAVVLMTLLALSAIVAITVMRPTQDNTAIMALIISATAPTTLALLAFMKAQETHLSVNSRLNDFMRTASELARAKGIAHGQALERSKQSALDEARLVADDKVADRADLRESVRQEARVVALDKQQARDDLKR
ncbi:MAG: hypothetical protein PHC88_05570 [Terrimicrobiaceae bacterium]|nr:hypothetical protein [Terrimicrobiaceae bacterium]